MLYAFVLVFITCFSNCYSVGLFADINVPDGPVKSRGKAEQGLMLELESLSSHFDAGCNIPLKINTINQSANEVSLAHSTLLETFAINVKRGASESVKLTSYGERIASNSNRGSVFIEQVKSGDRTVSSLCLNRFFDMTLADTYTIEVSRIVVGGKRVDSGRLTIRIVDPPTTQPENIISQ